MSESMEAKLKGAFIEADRCLQCYDSPCDKGCPAGVEVSRFIRLLSKGDILGAARTVEKSNPLGLICGSICPHNALCQKECTSHKMGRAIDIRTLQRFILEEARKAGLQNSFISNPEIEEQRINIDREVHKEKIETGSNNGEKVAVIGAGPSGLIAGLFLKELGYKVTIYDKNECSGGRLSKGIPDFRLSREVLSSELDQITSLLDIKYSKSFGSDFTIKALFEAGFDAIYIATGKWNENSLGIAGSGLDGVYTSDDILIRNDWKGKGHKSAAVIGAGNVAMDTARTLLKGDMESVYIVYRRTQKEMTAWKDELDDASDAGAVLQLLSSPVEIVGDDKGRVCALKCSRTQPVKDEKSGRRSAKPIDGYDFEIPVDMVVSAVGYVTDSKVYNTEGLDVDERGQIKVGSDLKTSIDGVFAGGDVIGLGRGTVVQAVGDGKYAAINIHKYLSERRGK